jgi:hypothetical protein
VQRNFFLIFLKKIVYFAVKKGSMRIFHSPQKRLVALICLGLSLASVLVFLPWRHASPFKAVPSQTALLLDFQGLSNIGQQIRQIKDTAWKNCFKTSVFKHCSAEIGAVEQLFHHDQTLRTAFAHQQLLTAYSLLPADSMHGLFILVTADAVDIEKILSSNKLGIIRGVKNFGDDWLYTVQTSNSGQMMITQRGRLLIFSHCGYLVEDALQQLNSSGNWWSNVESFHPSAGLRIFFRPQKWMEHVARQLRQAARAIPTLLTANVEWVGIAWNGATVAAMAQTTGFLSKIDNWKGSERGDIFTVMPDNTACFVWTGFGNKRMFFDALNSAPCTDFEQYVLPWVGREVAVVVTDPHSPALQNDRLLLLGVGDSALAQQSLEAYGKLRGRLAHEGIGMFEVFGFQGQSLLKPFFENNDDAFRNPYMVHLGKYVVVATNRQTMDTFIEKYIGNQTLAQNTDLLQLAHGLATKGHGLMVINTHYLGMIMQQLLEDVPLEEELPSDIEAFSALGWQAIELIPAFNQAVNLMLSTQPESISPPESSIYWKTNLGASVSSTIVALQKGQHSLLFVQDTQTQLYCLRSDGSIAWQKHLGERIQSDITNVEYDQNGQYYYLFNTPSQVWLVDEKGQDIRGYPLYLKTPASGGMTVVHFEQTANFNYFLGCSNGNYYGFDRFGRPLDGWDPQPNVGVVGGPLLHFQQGEKDYLVILSRLGKLTVLGRDGKPRFTPLLLEGNFSNPPFLVNINGKLRIVCFNDTGKIYVCNLEGTTQSYEWSGKIGKTPLKVAAWNLDGQTSFAVLQGRQVRALRLKETGAVTIFSRQFKTPQDDLFPIDGWMGLYSRKNKAVTMINMDGKTISGFPLAGDSRCCILRDDRRKVVVCGLDNTIYAYKTPE